MAKAKKPKRREFVVEEPLPLYVARAFARAYSITAFGDGSFFRFEKEAGNRRLEDEELERMMWLFLPDVRYPHATKDGQQMRKLPRQTSGFVSDVRRALRAVVACPGDALPVWIDKRDVDPENYLCVSNGLLRLTDHKLLDADPYFLPATRASVTVEPRAKPEKWLEFIDSLWPGDSKSQNLLQEVMGAVVSCDSRDQKIFYFRGATRAGKSVIAKLLRSICGERFTTSSSIDGLSRPFGLQCAVGKSLIVIPDFRIGNFSRISEVTSRLLEISGGDQVYIDRKNQTPLATSLRARVLLVSNEPLSLRDTSGALAHRMIPLRFERSFLGREDPDLYRKLERERASIFNWAMDGYLRLRKRGEYTLPEASLEELSDLRRIGSPISSFMEDCCHFGGHSTPTTELFAAWRLWCDDAGNPVGSRNSFMAGLKSAAESSFQVALQRWRPARGDARKWEYKGIKLRDDVVARLATKETEPRTDERHDQKPRGSARQRLRSA